MGIMYGVDEEEKKNHNLLTSFPLNSNRAAIQFTLGNNGNVAVPSYGQTIDIE